MRRFWLLVAAGAWLVSLIAHAIAWLGVTFDGNVLFWTVLVSVIVICTPCAVLVGQSGGPKSTAPQAKRRARIIHGVMVGLGLYLTGITYTGMTPEQRKELHERGEVSLWAGERAITVGQARYLTAFPLPFFAIAALMLWDRMQRERESLDL